MDRCEDRESPELCGSQVFLWRTTSDGFARLCVDHMILRGSDVDGKASEEEALVLSIMER